MIHYIYPGENKNIGLINVREKTLGISYRFRDTFESKLYTQIFARFYFGGMISVSTIREHVRTYAKY